MRFVLKLQLYVYVLLFCCISIKASPKTSNKVLIISSYGADYQWSNSIIDCINLKMQQSCPGIELNIEYLSSELFVKTENWKLKLQTMLDAYQDATPLAITFISDEAWLTYNSLDTEQFKDIPLLLCAVKPHTIHIDKYSSNLTNLQLSDFSQTLDVMKQYNATGILREMNIDGYINLMQNTIPGMSGMVLVTDNRFYGIYTRLVFEERIKEKYSNYPVEYLDARAIKTDSLLKRIPAITVKTGVLLTSWLTGEHGFEYSKDYIYKEMASILKTPIFITNNIGLEKGYFLGGYYNKADYWGEKAGDMLVDIIRKNSAKDISPIIEKDEQCYINWNTLHKFTLSADNLPNNAIIINNPESVFKKYKVQISVIVFVFILILIIYIYTLQSHLKLLETRKNLVIALNKAEESDKLKSAFLANMSHEIRTPLNSIVGFSGLIATAETEEEREEFLFIIKRNNDLLLQLISDILDISKMESGTLSFYYQTTDMNSVCNDIITTLKPRCREGVELLFIPPQENMIIITDQNRLTQVFINLVNNSIKFTESGSIEIGYYPYDTELIECYVKDTGIGIPQEQTQNIFNRFVKLNNYIEGTGLGLPICKTIVEILGGEIGVESQVGHGSIFRFRIKTIQVTQL